MTKGGFESLLVYQKAVTIADLTVTFCEKFLGESKYRRTVEQMVQAARSGKQNIVEGSLEKSMEGNIKLTGVARASFGELLEDYKDFLRQRSLALWSKDDPRVLKIRSYKTHETYESYRRDPESFANLMVTLCFTEGYLLDQLLRAQEQKFIKEGGFRENLFRKRQEYRRGLP
ncbi:four helix bundle protein [Candidatus Gottesmanbacteria bacterium]|nr:four helix bundle protein [Candidatus Gottesmanbacteria bacterium]